MGKGAELWDDSALISAFDAAMASYKEIHNECLSEHSLEKDKDESNKEEIHNECLSEHSLEKDKDESNKKVSDIVLTRENDESNTMGSDSVFIENAKSGIKIESEVSNHDVDDNMKETCGSSWSDPSTQQKNVGDNCAAPDFKSPISDHPSVDPNVDSNLECYSDHQIRNYNELLKQYYELEQRKEKIAEQLWSANYWNYQTPAQCSTSQEQQAPVSSCSELSPNISCPWCTCQCLTTTSTSISACPVANTLCMGYACCPQQMCCFRSQVQQEAGDAFSMNSIIHSTQEDGETVETGIVAIEMVTNSIEANLSRKSNLSEEKKGEHDVSSTSKCPRTDLTSVLNAWYWAGFKTGRYLLEQEQEQADKLNKQG